MNEPYLFDMFAKDFGDTWLLARGPLYTSEHDEYENKAIVSLRTQLFHCYQDYSSCCLEYFYPIRQSEEATNIPSLIMANAACCFQIPT